jgi:hypothetical protein
LANPEDTVTFPFKIQAQFKLPIIELIEKS